MLQSIKSVIPALKNNYRLFLVINPLWSLLHLPLLFYFLDINYQTAAGIDLTDQLVYYITKLTATTQAERYILSVRNTLYILTILLYSPFSIAAFNINKEVCHHNSSLTFKKYFSFLKKYLFKSLVILAINLSIIYITFNIYWYHIQQYYRDNLLLFYLSTSFLMLFYFGFVAVKLYTIPIFLNEEKRYIAASKRSYNILISNFSASLLITVLFCGFFYWITFLPKIPVLVFLFIILPTLPGQLLFENYFTVTQKYGNKKKQK
ncbi:MAG TPA: hypothetical protein VKS21_05425 [Spirochaetota bacterium]|nr:hypothetical protein [Spirochaetota bacterium]